MYTCPGCKSEEIEGKDRCRCGADLSLLLRLTALADAWFNRALEAHAQGQPARALELLSACCVVRPDDAEARVVQAQILAQLGRWLEAREAARAAREIDPDRPELPGLESALADGATADSPPILGAAEPVPGAMEVAPGAPAKPARAAPSRRRKKAGRREMKSPKRRH